MTAEAVEDGSWKETLSSRMKLVADMWPEG